MDMMNVRIPKALRPQLADLMKWLEIRKYDGYPVVVETCIKQVWLQMKKKQPQIEE